jgi:chromate transport protein ChrA
VTAALHLLVPVIGGILGLEFVIVLFQNQARRARLMPTVLAGFFIVLAWNASNEGLLLPLILAALLCALIAHATDIRARW